MWSQAAQTGPSGQTAALRALSQSTDGLTLSEIAVRASLAPDEVRAALTMLERHAVENHQDGASDDFLWLAEQVQFSPAFGVTLDTGNPLAVGWFEAQIATLEKG